MAAPIPAGDRRTLAGQIATRDRAWDAWAISGWLPNPDPVLKALGTDISTYRDLRSDAHIAGCIRRRKAAVRALDPQWESEGTPTRVLKSLQGILADLAATPDPDEPGAQAGLAALIGEAQDGALYGYQPLELTWGRVGALLVPTVVQGKPPEWFLFDTDNRLRFRARDRGLDGERLPARKFLCARQEPSYQNPYGLPDLSLVFWPATFRKGGSKFWARWLEKYGGTFLLGKLPRTLGSQTETDRAYQDLADQLAEMVEDAVGVVPDDGSVAPLESGDKAGSSDAFERYLLYWRSEITIALLGSNQGMEQSSTHASASASLQVGDDLRDADARMVEAVVNQLIRWTCAVNWPAAAPPRWVLREQEEIDQVRPARDKLLVEAGVTFSREYWRRTYDLDAADLAAVEPASSRLDPSAAEPAAVEPASSRLEAGATGLAAGSGSRRLAGGASSSRLEAGSTPDAIDRLTDRLEARARPALAGMIDQIRGILNAAGSLEEAATMLEAAYPDLDAGPLAEQLRLGMTEAALIGVADVDAGVGP